MTAIDDSMDSFEPESAEAAFAEVVADAGDRIRRGEPVDPLDYPEFETSLREILPTLRMVTELRVSAAPQTEIRRLGDFEILREVGRGGMGVVYEAIQNSLGRRVALKVLQRGSALDPRQLRRFQLEAQAAASLQHPHLVEVYSSGSTDGVPYYAMRYVEGRDLARVIRERRRQRDSAAGGRRDSTATAGGACSREVARIALQAAEALEHAHACDVVHRDVKPSNLLVDDFGHVWITDFGLARITGGLDLTATGDVLGTPRYMSPEQAAGRRDPYDGRADVYSLGATMYELATLRPAFPGEDRVDVLRRIAQDEPVPPRKLEPTLPVDLETIILKAMAKNPAERYATAGDMAADLARFLDDRPIRAHRPSFVDHARKWLWRRRKLVAVVGLATVCFAVGLTLAVLKYTVLLRRHNEELTAEVARADRNARLAERHAYVSNLRMAAQAVEGQRWEHAQEALDASVVSFDGRDPRGFGWQYLRRLASREIVLLPGPAVATHEIVLAPDGSKLRSRGVDDVVRAWDFPPAGLPVSIGRFAASNAVFSHDGRLVAGERLESPGRPKNLVVWDAADGRIVKQWTLDPSTSDPQRIFYPRIIDDGRMAVCIWDAGGPPPSVSVRSWNLQDADLSPQPTAAIDHVVYALFAPLSRRFVTLEDGGFNARDASSSAVSRRLMDFQQPRATALSDDGRRLILDLAERNEVVVLDTDDGRELEHRKLGAAIHSLHPDATGDWIAAAEASATIHVWNQASGYFRTLQESDPSNASGVRALAFSPDHKYLAVSWVRKASGLLPVVVWELATGRRFGPPPSPDPTTDTLAFTPDGRALVIAGPRSPRIWRFDPPPEIPQPAGHKDEGWSVAFSLDGKILATGSDDTDEPQTIKLWDPATGALIRGWHGGEGTVAALEFTPDGRTLISVHLASSNNVRLWNVADGRLLGVLAGHDRYVRTLAVSPDGKTLATGGVDKSIRVWDLASRICLRRLEGHVANVRGLAFSRDGRRIASACAAGGLRLWNVADGAVLQWASAAVKLVGVVFSPDDRLIATADEDGVVVLRDSRTLAPVRSIRGDIDAAIDLAFAPDGRVLATCGMSGTIRLWDVLAGQEFLTLKGHAAQVNDVAFSPDGRILASIAHDGAVRLWRGYPEDPFTPRP